MKQFKSITIYILLISLIIFSLKVSAAASDSISIGIKQQEVDALFKELNELAAEKRMLFCQEQASSHATASSNAVKLESIDNRQSVIENRIEEFGFNIIDSNNAEDMAQLEEVLLGNTSVRGTESIPDPPDLDVYTDCYTIAQYNGSVNFNGTNYRYSYIYVTDNKGYTNTPLTVTQTTNILVGKEQTILGDILDYQFSFAFSSYLGLIPGGWVADWTIGTAFSVLDALDELSPISYVGNSDIYNMSMISVTQMMYCYIYIPGYDWVLCGVCAPNISYARAEYFVANINGTAYSEATNYPTITSSTGIPVTNYVANYVNGLGCTIHEIGSFTVNTYAGRQVRFTPGFARYPMFLT